MTTPNGAPSVTATAAHIPATAPGPEPTPEFDADELPNEIPTLQIEIDADAQASLDEDPWNAEDVLGTFIDENGTRYEGIELNYRGAYALQTLVSAGNGERNWKVKLTDDAPYLGRKEWNFNREPHLRQKLAYDLMRFAGVRVPSAEHVQLVVNGKNFGLYLRYEDPDNKSWLKDMFGSAAGDLYKAATDQPNEQKHFALLTKLGASDEDYFLHYNKKLNNEGAAETDYSELRTFIDGLNDTGDSALQDWFERNLDTSKFINYLVVSNFISNWDSYPQRPKNYWLYHSPVTQRWIYVPWDMDATFQREPNSLHPMGDRASIFHEFDEFEGNDPDTDEGSERPLVRRLMQLPKYRQAYVARYLELRGTILNLAYLSARTSELSALIDSGVSEDEARAVRDDTERLLDFVRTKIESADAELLVK
jgi:spore coat protein H